MSEMIVLVEDDSRHREFFNDWLTAKGYRIVSFEDAEAALKFLTEDLAKPKPTVSLIISDVRLPKMSGIDLGRKIQKIDSRIPLILMTDFADVADAVSAVKEGAYDYVPKPFHDLDGFELVIIRALSLRRLESENRLLKERIQNSLKFGEMIGKSPGMKQVFSVIKKVSGTDANVLIMGESGTGKELVARALHYHSPRKNKDFVAINCSAIPEALLESELFGHAKGAFTGAVVEKSGLFEKAEGGTIFLDEVGDMPIALQSKVLRTLQEKTIRPVGKNSEVKINVRIIAATHRNLRKEIIATRFREDLFFRLNVIPINIPPLRDRREDIPYLAQMFTDKYASTYSRDIHEISPHAMGKLMNLPYPGNVRELENIIERAVIMTGGKRIEVDDIPVSIRHQEAEFFTGLGPDLLTLETMESQYLDYVLNQKKGNHDEAARVLGISRRTLYRKIQIFRHHSPSQSYQTPAQTH